MDAEFSAIEVANAQSNDFKNEPIDTYGIVAILVDSKIFEDGEKYEGLAEEDYPATPSSSIEKRVKRYAEEVQSNLPYTKSLIISVDTEKESIFDVASTLEKLYFDGDASSAEEDFLIGAVFVGDLPLPVVNKNGNRFISMLPYTDFVEKSYIYNPETDAYEKDSRVNFPRSEIWHGVIQGSPEELAIYFDKNHLYHVGHEDFADFDKSILLSDFYHEQQLMNSDFFKFYDRFTKFSEDLAYLRMNKHWAEDLYEEFVGDVSSESGDVMQPEFKEFLDNTLSNGLFANLPDVMAKQAVIEKYHMPYVKLFTRYLSLTNDWTDSTGRYERADAQSVIELISTKDLYNQEYLKQVNDLLEAKVESMVQKALQKHIPLISHSTLSGNIIVEVEKEVEDGPDEDNLPDIIIEEEKLPFVNSVKGQEPPIAGSDPELFNVDAPLFAFLNHSLISEAAAIHPATFIKADEVLPIPADPDEEGAEAENDDFGANGPEISASFELENASEKLYINGLNAEDIESVLDCSLYRGSSLLTFNNRIYNHTKAGETMFLGVNTTPFFEYQGYDYGLLVAKNPLTALPAVVKDSPADLAGIKEGDILLSINDTQLNNEFTGRLMLEDVLPKLKADENPAQIKYYSLEEDQEFVKEVNLEDANSPEWSAGCHGTNGLEIDGSDNAAKCMPQTAKLPLFDLAAAKEISVNDLHSGEDVDTAHIRSCYDIYYDPGVRYQADFTESVQPFVQVIKEFTGFNANVTNYLNPNSKFTASADLKPNAEDIILYDDKGFKLTFSDILKHSGAFDGVDNDEDGEVDEEDESDEIYAVNEDDWSEIGHKILSRSGTFEFFVPKISSKVEITIEPNVVKQISSMIPHKEPLNETIGAQFRAKATESLPIDAVRYLAFVDQNGNLQKFNYPNTFKAKSYTDLKIKFYKLAQKMAELPGADKLVDDSINAKAEAGDETAIANELYLQLLRDVAAQEELYEENETAHKYLAETSSKKLEDAITWNNIGIDDKHAYVLQSYLNPQKDAYADEKNGYEALYFVADGEADYASFSFHGDYPAMEFDDSLAQLEAELLEGGPYVSDDDESNANVSSSGTENLEVDNQIGEEVNLEALPLWEWFPEMAEWIKETTEAVTAIANVDFQNDQSCIIDQNFNIYSVISEQQKQNAVKDGILDRFYVKLEKNVLRADGGDSTTLTIMALNEDGNYISGANTYAVKLLIKPDNQKILTLGSDKTTFVNGLASFKLNSTNNTGTVVVQADALNTKKRVLSKPITITSTKRSIDLLGELNGESSDSITAGSETPLTVKAVLFDETEEVAVQDDSSSVRFTIVEGNSSATVEKENVTAKNGVATNRLIIKKNAGVVKLRAEIVGSNYPAKESEFFVMPGPLHHIDVMPESSVIKAGGLSYTPVRVELQDQFNNVKNDEIFDVTLWHEGPAEFRNVEDRDLNKAGIQVFVPEGVTEFEMLGTDVEGLIRVHAEMDRPSDNGEFNELVGSNELEGIRKLDGVGEIESRYDIFLKGKSNKAELRADAESEALITVEVKDGNGILDAANLPVSFAISNGELAEFSSQPANKFKDGLARVSVKSKTVSGDFEVIASSPGFDSVSIPVKIKPLEPYQLRFLPVEENLIADDSSTLELEAEILDIHGNFVEDESSLKVNFAISDSTSMVAQFLGADSLIAQNGRLKPVIKATKFSGPVRIVAGSENLPKGDSIELFSEKRLYSSSLKDAEADVLFASLLGNAFGDVSKEDNLGSELLFSGRTQAVSAITAAMQQSKSLFSVDAKGAVQVADGVEANYKSSNGNASDGISFSNLTDKSLLAEMMLILPSDAFVSFAEPEEDSKPGVYLSNFADLENYEIKQSGNSYALYYKNRPQIDFNARGQIKILEGNYVIEPKTDAKYLAFTVGKTSVDILDVLIVPESDKDVQLLASAKKPDNEAGVYLTKHSKDRKYALKSFFSGNSTLDAKGYSFVDTSEAADASQQIGGPFTSLDGSFDKAGIGFSGQNKHMLLFFAGNNVGDSFKHYASESGIILGDPTVKIDASLDDTAPLYDENSGFTDDLGQSVYTNNKNIQSLITFDYNSDSIDDLLIAFDDGRVRLLEGLRSSPTNPFRDKGDLLNLVNGIYDLDVGDVNNDGQEDIVVATRESCNVGETCVYVYENNNGYFVHKNAELNLAEKVNDLQVVDLNKDGYEDVLVADLNRAIYAFYGSAQGLEIQGRKIGGLEAKASEGTNAAHQTFIAYNRSAVEKEAIRQNFAYDPIIQMVLPSANPADSAPGAPNAPADHVNKVAGLNNLGLENVEVSIAQFQGKKLYEFLPLDRDLRVSNSIKKVKDLNGDNIRSGDVLSYTITIVNSGSNIANASLLDYVPDTFEFNPEDISCEGCTNALTVIRAPLDTRPYLISGLNIPAGGVVRINYEVKAATFPPIKLLLGDKLDDYEPDEYLDIAAFAEETPQNRVVYVSQNKDSKTGYMQYQEFFPASSLATVDAEIEVPDTTTPQHEFQAAGPDNNGNGLPDTHEGIDEDTPKSYVNSLLPSEQDATDIEDYFRAGQFDRDMDGVPDALDVVNGTLNEVADNIEAVIGALKCSGGCIPMPVNMTLNVPFPVPGKVNLFGIPGPYIPGIPLFSINKPSTLAPPVINTPIWPGGNPFYFESLFRIYASPTLTGGLGTAMCLGNYAYTEGNKDNSCFIFAVPVLQMLGVCKALTEGLTGALDSIVNGAKSTTSSLQTIVATGSTPETTSNAVSGSGFTSGPYPISATASANVRIPGFPSVITNWLDRQTEEIIDSLVDLPDIYVILPDPRSLVGEELTQEFNPKTMHEFLGYLNSIPLIQIEQKEVPIKIPWMYADQIAKTKREYILWVEHIKEDWERFKKTFNCDEDTFNSICNKVSADVSKLITTMEKNIKLLDEYRKLPKKLIQFRDLEAQYVRQLVCYLDTIIEFTSGYVERQGDRIDAWLKAVDDVKNIVKNWKVLIDVSVAYAESCDACKNDKFSLLEVMTKVLVVVPDPPIIELPKLPDIVLDASQIQTGLKLTLPDFVFIPEPLILPPPPRFQFPDVILPEVKVVLPPVPTLPEVPDILTKLPELPNLPPLPLPKLPDLPPPPKIPKLPDFATDLAFSLEAIFRIMCLIKTGLLPLEEPSVATQFETLTQRGLSPLLPAPFDLGLTFELPGFSYTYVEEIEVIAKLNLQLDFDFIYKVVKDSADIANSFTEYGIDAANKYIEEGGKYMDVTIIDPSQLNLPINDLEIDLGKGSTGESGAPAIHDALSSYVKPEVLDVLTDDIAELEGSIAQLNRNFETYAEEVEKINAYSRSLPEEINLVASSELVDSSHAIFNHSVADIKSRIEQRSEEHAPTQLLAMRDQLIAYHDSLEEGRAGLEGINDAGEALRFIAKNDVQPLSEDLLADLSGGANLGSSTYVTEQFVIGDQSDSDWAKNEGQKIKERLVALTDEEGSESNGHNGASPKGVFVYDEERNINHALISYIEEVGSVSHMAYLDADQDLDEDILISFAGDVYLKRNYSKNVESGYYNGPVKTLELKDLRPSAESIDYLQATHTSNELVRIAWDAAKDEDVKAYELDVKYRFSDFEDVNSSGSVAHFVPKDDDQDDVKRPDYYEFEVVAGDLLINAAIAEPDYRISFGDVLRTGDSLNTEVHLDAFSEDAEFLGRVKLGANSTWNVQKLGAGAHVFNVNEGEIIFDMSSTSNPFLRAGDTFVTGNSVVLLEFANRSYKIKENQSFNLPKNEFAQMYVGDTDLFTTANINTFERSRTSSEASGLEEGTILHFLEDSAIKAIASNSNETLFELKQKAHSFYRVPAGLPLDAEFNISGEVEIIKTGGAISFRYLEEGQAILPKDFIYMSDGQATLRYTNSPAFVNLRAEQSFTLYELDNAERPEASLELLNGNYYAVMSSLRKDGTRSTGSLPTILAPQSCGDRLAPYINVGDLNKSIPIFSNAEVDASSSFDTAGEIVGYYADINLNEDSNGDGDSTNDADQFSDLSLYFDANGDGNTQNDKDNPKFNFGPYNEPGEHKVKIFAVDQSGNASGQIVVITVFVPEIFLDPASARTGILSGYIEPRLKDMPIGFIRDREGIFTEFTTDSADEKGKYYTNLDGEFEAADLAVTNILLVRNAKGEPVAEVDPVTGNITLNDPSYSVSIEPARPPEFPTRAVISDKNGNVVSSFFVVPDLNSDTKVVSDFNQNDKAVQTQLSEGGKNFEFRVLPGNDPNNPGATQITYIPENKVAAIINTSGNIFIFDDRLTLELFDPEAKTYDIHKIRLMWNGGEIAVVYLASINDDSEIQPIPERDLYKINALGDTPKVPVVKPNTSPKTFELPFEDVDPNSEYANAIRDLAEKGIIDGYKEDGKVLYKPEQLISRAEYTKILLRTLCIEPRPEAYEAPSVFSDIGFDENNIPWFYPFVKESYLQNFTQGYVGEKDEETGLAPFKAGNTISRAEAAVIILSALDELGIADLEGVEPGNPWYAPYMEVSKNLSPYLTNPQENSQIFLLTADEAADPTKQISRAEFAVMAQRVLNAHNCFAQDSDGDGMPDQWEEDNGLDPNDAEDGNKDPDEDFLSNADEFKNFSDPFNPDTDGGCMLDGKEVNAGFSPLLAEDDDPDFDGLSCDVEINIYKTNPRAADTDAGGIDDGTEVLKDGTDPLNGDDDKKKDDEGDSPLFNDFKSDLDEGVYAIEESCNACPCPASLDHKTDIIDGDKFWAVITAPDDNTNIYRKSNSVTITDVP